MGCASSTESSAVATNRQAPPTPTEKKREKEITAGTETMAVSTHHEKTDSATKNHCNNNTPLVVGNLTVRYACASQRGRDPDDASKPNQDCFGVHETLSRMDAFFGVYDGHGQHGEPCSRFVQEQLPNLIRPRLLEQQNDSAVLTNDQVQTVLHEAHLECNDKLRLSKINDSYSGATSITLYLHAGRITVCNVGDSRAILGTQQSKNASLLAVPLSKDQTPYRSDEAARCVKSGARILSFGQIDPSTQNDDDDDEDDPPRVWSQKGKFPGTAFTRSFGDAVAEQLGVFAEPEMLTLKLSPKEKLLVLASDGIFDVMSNQEVIDLCCSHERDPAKACRVIINKAHEEWLLNEECVDEESANYDDMTVVCVFIDHVGDERTPVDGTTTHNAELPAPQKHHHPKRVRQKTLRNLEEMELDQ